MNDTVASRTYRQTSRADSAAATHQRILDAFEARARTGWMDEITLDEVARDAGVTVQTVIRRFGGKEGLLNALAEQMGRSIMQGRGVVATGDWRGHIQTAVADYEVTGDFVLRLLAQEERWPALKPALSVGRSGHRNLVVKVYEPWLGPLKQPDREQRIATLVTLTDVYVWRLLRRDQGLSVQTTTATMVDLVARLIGENANPRR